MPMNANQVWIKNLRNLIASGQRTNPRGMDCRELIGFTSKVNMDLPLVYQPSRKLGKRFAFAEAAWILSGDNRVSTIKKYAPNIVQFSDDGVYFRGSYGPPVRDQVPYILNTIYNDDQTRQAVLTIWRQRPGKSKDIPCTVAMQWVLRDSKLDCIVYMRSSDIWLGLPYDIFNFTALTSLLLINLRQEEDYANIELGTLHHFAGSLHLYDINYEQAKNCIKEYDYITSREDHIHYQFPYQSMKTEDEFIEYLWRKAES